MSKFSQKSKSKSISPNNSFVKQIVEAYSINPYEPLNIKQLCKKLGISDPSSKQIVQNFIFKLEDKKVLIPTSRSKHKLNPNLISQISTGQQIIGIVDMKASGKAYIISKDTDEDIFVSSNNTGNSFNGDTVKVQLFPKRGRHKNEGKVVEVLKRATELFVGKIEISKNFAFLIPDKTKAPNDFFIPTTKINGAKNGDKVIVKFTEWPEHAKNPFAEVVEILGKPGDNDVEMKSILAANDFPISFPKSVLELAKKIENVVSTEEIKSRRDYREIFTCTIDPEDAKDFDDALSLQKLGNGNWEVGVHIADVSYYVKKGSAIDKEAYTRGTSIYLVDRVVPMLPEQLSNLVCSLRPDEEKLTFSAVFELNDKAEIKKEWIGRTVIKSNRRYSYDEVQAMIEGAEGDEYKDLLLKLNDLSSKIREERFKKGSIAFRSQEIRFKLDENSKPIGAYVRQQKEAHKLIEDFMLLANKTIAERIGIVKGKSSKPRTFVYRIHNSPNPEKLQTFAEFIKKFGYRVSLTNRKSFVSTLNELFDEIKGKGEEHLIETIAVRTMAKAIYSTNNIGHYGLSFSYYTHFTSPIRRYPDLMVHRLIEHYLNGGASVNEAEFEEYCEHCSDMERKAVDAERESVRYKQAEFMLEKVGQEFAGVISGVSKWGVFVEIDEVKAEGLVPIASLTDDYYYLDEENYQIVGRKSNNIYRLGDAVVVFVQSVDLVKKQMEFSFIKEKY